MWREFGLQTIRHLCPCVRCSLAFLVVFRPGDDGVHVAQTLRFSRLIACLPTLLGLTHFGFQNRCLARVQRTGVLQTSVFCDLIGPCRPRVQKSAVDNRFRVHLSKTIAITKCNHIFCPFKGTLGLLVAVLYCFPNLH